jgi:ribosomal protein S18 acetylase RimI-like enzyme
VNDILVRRAVDTDASRLASLRHDFWQNQTSKGLLDVPRVNEPDIEAARKFIARPRSVVVVATAAELVGYAMGTLQIAPHLVGSKVAIVEEIYVDPQAGARGVGSQLADAVFSHLLASGEGRRQVRVLPGNDAALRFWSKQGFKPTLLTLERG